MMRRNLSRRSQRQTHAGRGKGSEGCRTAFADQARDGGGRARLIRGDMSIGITLASDPRDLRDEEPEPLLLDSRGRGRGRRRSVRQPCLHGLKPGWKAENP